MKKSIAAIFVFALSINITSSFKFDILCQGIKTTALEGQLKSFLENLKEIMRSGNSTLGIPVLDPFETDFKNININNDLLNADFNVSNAKIRGLSDYIINDANFKFAGKQLTVNLTWSSIQVKTSYSLDVFQEEWPDFPIYGNGYGEFDAKDFTFAIKIKLNIATGTRKLSVNTLSSSISLGSIDFDATGIYNNKEASETISKIISSSLPYAIDYFGSLFIGVIDSELTKLIESYICDKTWDDIIKIFG